MPRTSTMTPLSVWTEYLGGDNDDDDDDDVDDINVDEEEEEEIEVDAADAPERRV